MQRLAATVTLVALCLASAAGRTSRSSSAGGGSGAPHAPPPPEIQAQLTPILATADRLFESQQYAQAQQALEQALELWPAEPVARFKLGMLLQQGQRPDLALTHLEAAAKYVAPRHPMRADVVGALGRLELHTAKAEQQAARRAALMASGVDHLHEALELRPQLTKADPMLPRLLAEAESELGGRREAPVFDADWAEGSSWAEDPEFASIVEAAAGISAGAGTGTVERREVGSLGWVEFRDRYRGSGDEAGGGVGRPVLLTNATAGWGAHGPAWDKQRLLRRYGGVTAAIRWAVGTRQFGLIERQESLGRYVQTISEALPQVEEGAADGGAGGQEQVLRAGMLFGNLCDVEQLDGCSLGLSAPPPPEPEDEKEKREEVPDWWVPELMAEGGITNPGISLGPSRAGLPWHNHDAAWQAVVRGAKLFLLLPPLQSSPTSEADEEEMQEVGDALGRVLLPHPKDFVMQWSNSTAAAEDIWRQGQVHSGQKEQEEEEEEPVRVLQWVVVTPGDALFIPCNWWHATLNIGETVAVGGQQLQGKVVEGGSCPKDLYADAAGAMTAVSRGLQQVPLFLSHSCSLMFASEQKYRDRFSAQSQ